MINDNPKIYVGTYKKYNEGSLYGAWVDLTEFENKKEFIKHCQKLHKDEKEPELMYQDFECFPDAMYSECHIHDELWDWMELNKDQAEILEAFMILFCPNFKEALEGYEECYMGKHNSFRAFAKERFFDLNEIPEHLESYICIDRVEREYRIDYSEHNGHVFYSNY